MKDIDKGGFFVVFKVKVYAIFFGTQGFSTRRDGRYSKMAREYVLY
jgi:hypothetical protein